METKRADIDTIKCISGADSIDIYTYIYIGKEMSVDVFARNRVWTRNESFADKRINLSPWNEFAVARFTGKSRLFHVCLSKPVSRGFLTCVCLFGQQPINRIIISFREKFQIFQKCYLFIYYYFILFHSWYIVLQFLTQTFEKFEKERY